VNVTGALVDEYGNGLRDKTIVLYYTFSGIDTWTPISSDTTDPTGHYFITWIPTATGYFSLKAEWSGNETHTQANNVTTLASLPYNNQYMFTVESNSTVTDLDFNATNRELSFTAIGQNDTKGYAKITVPRSLVIDDANINVYIDNVPAESSVAETSGSWLLSLVYPHSSHKITINLGSSSTPFVETTLGKAIIYGLPTITVLAILGFLALRKRRKSP
jgi:hypothetical protein